MKKDKHLKISFIIPCFNAEKTIDLALKSILNQSYNNYEIIVIDGMSTDNTPRIAKKFSNKINFISEKDDGIYDAMNKGIKLSSGDWIFFMGADDEILPYSTAKIFSRKLKSDIQFIYGNVFFDSGRKMKCSFGYKMLFGHSVYHQANFYHKDIFKDFKYPVQYKMASDYFLDLYIWKKKIKSFYSNIYVSKCGDNGLSKQAYLFGYYETVKIAYDLMGFLSVITFISSLVRFFGKRTIILIRKLRKYFDS
jgi:putative colanic acid biosynthesis glycosyltransferase